MNNSVRQSGHVDAGVRREVVCVVCGAGYAPAQGFAYLLEAPPMALESAFMSICHFCFRCRRPSCPGCWDDVHGVCGVCSQEAKLPFRADAPPLHGMLFPPPRRSPSTRERSTATPLVCVRPGRFQSSSPTVIDWFPEPEPEPPTPLEDAPTPQALLELQPTAPQPIPPSPPPARLPASPRVFVEALDELPTRPQHTQGRRIWHALVLILLLLLLLVVLVIVLAELSVRVNSFLLTLLHVDIRAEMAYLLRILQKLIK